MATLKPTSLRLLVYMCRRFRIQALNSNGGEIKMKINDIKCKIAKLNEAQHGTFVGAELTDESADRLAQWIDEQGFKTPQRANDLHTTIAIDKKKAFAYAPEIFDPPVVIQPESYEFAMFGSDQDVLVMKFRSPELEQQHRILKKKYKFQWDFDSYSPHVTLAYKTESMPKELPDFPLEFRREYVQPFDPPPVFMKEYANPESLYFGTTNLRLEQIQQQGYVDAGSVWASLSVAEFHADDAVEEDGCGEPIVLEIPLDRFDVRDIKPHEQGIRAPETHVLELEIEQVWESWKQSNRTWQSSLDIVGSVMYENKLRVNQTLYEAKRDELNGIPFWINPTRSDIAALLKKN